MVDYIGIFILQIGFEILNTGKGEVIWPDPFIDRISACAGELTHCAEADIKDGNGTKTGSVEIIARLQTKCLEFQWVEIYHHYT